MSVDATLDAAFSVLLAKARQEERQQAIKPYSINFGFGGGGQPIQTDPILLTPTGIDPVVALVPAPLTIVKAYMVAFDASGILSTVDEASIDVQIAQFDTLGASVPLYGAGPMPQLFALPAAELVTTDWQANLITGDILIARLNSFTGLASLVALLLLYRPTEVPIGVSQVTDAGGTTLTDSNGNTLVLRS